MKNIIMAKDGEDSWIRWIKKRIHHNLNFLAIFEGPPGIGKSWSALSIAHSIDSSFNPREQVAFSFKELMRIINKFNDKTTELSKRKYKVIVFDEAQTDLSNREWQSKVNKLFNYLLSTFRHQQIILLFTSPYSDFIDSASMKLIHCKFEVKGWNKKTRKTQLRPKLLQYNPNMKKFYYHSLYVIAHKKVNKLVHWFIDSPPQHIIEPYEAMKSAFTLALNKEITQELEDADKEQETDHKPLTAMQQAVYDGWVHGDSMEDIAKELKIGVRMAYTHLKMAKKKGYAVIDRRDRVL